MSYVKILIDSSNAPLANESGVTGVCGIKTSDPHGALNKVINILSGIVGGIDSSTVEVQAGAGKATAVVGFGGPSGIAGDETVLVNGVTFTAKDSSPSGQYEFQNGITGPNFKDSATNLAAKINATTNAKISGLLTATVSGVTGLAYVTLTAVEPGVGANGYTVTTTASGATGVANFTGGTKGPSNAQVSK